MIEEPTCHTLEDASARALTWLASHLAADGSYGPAARDLACHYKSPYLYLIHGKLRDADRLLSFLARSFMRENGDFMMPDSYKSANAAFNEYWAYINGWIVMAAQKMGRFDVSYAGYRYLESCYHPELGGFATHRPDSAGDGITDVLTTAHLGLTALYRGDCEKAEAAGRLLQRFVELQPDLRSGFYLRLDRHGQLMTQVPPERALFFVVSAGQPEQAYFMIGYPIAFLGKLYQATGREGYLSTAKSYLDFALACHSSLRTFPLSHKVAWGAALIAKLTRDARYEDLSRAIVTSLLSLQQPNGAWFSAEPAHISFDQTAEIAIWLKEISVERGPSTSNEQPPPSERRFSRHCQLDSR